MMDIKIKKGLAVVIALLSQAVTLDAKLVSDQRSRIQGQIKIQYCDSVSFIHHTYYSAVSQLFRTDTTFMLDVDGRFDFQIDVTHPVYIGIHPIKDGRKLSNTGNYNVFLVLPGDDVFISFYDDTVTVAGKGSDKYETIIKVSAPNYLDAGVALARMRESQTLDQMTREDYLQVERHMDSLYTEKCNLLEQYRGRLTSDEYQLMRYDLDATFQDAQMSALYLFGDVGDEAKKLIYSLKKPYLFGFSAADGINSEIKAYTQHYTTYLIRRLVFWNRARIPDRLEPVELDRVFDEIIDNFSGLLRERLIMDFLLSLKTYYDIDRFVEMAKAYVDEPIFKNSLVILDKAKRGEPFYGFNLPDSSGNRVNESRLRGKYLLIDFWFTGCLYCTVLTRRMAEDVEKWMAHPDFQMVSVSIDKSPAVWKRSLSSGKYSHQGAIDVYTEGEGGMHPFIKHYSIENYPTLLLVNPEGNVLEIESGAFNRVRKILNEQLKL